MALPLSSVQAQEEWYCWSCPECQKVQLQGPKMAPLIPIFIISVHFKCIRMFLVGLVCEEGHTHMLVVIDYATRYPKVIPSAVLRMGSWPNSQPKEM